MDAFARGLLIAQRVIADGKLQEFKRLRYASFDGGKGKDFERGKMSLEHLRDHAAATGEPEQRSGKQELLENYINDVLYSSAC